MAKPKLQIIVLFQNLGDERQYFAEAPAPPLSGVLLAALTPPVVEVELLHEMVRPIDYETDADFIALSFMDYCAPHAIEVARRFRRLGKKVVAGGRYASTFPRALVGHFDCVVVGEAEQVWPRVVADLVANRLEPMYEAPFAPDLPDIPPPRYDLVEPAYAISVVTEATRGCPFRCTYCQLQIRPAPFRTRPIPDVIRDLTATSALPFHRRKMAMIYDNNFARRHGLREGAAPRDRQARPLGRGAAVHPGLRSTIPSSWTCSWTPSARWRSWASSPSTRRRSSRCRSGTTRCGSSGSSSR